MYSKSIHYWYWIQIGYVLLDIIAIFIEELMSYFFDRFIKISMIAENCVTGFMAACRLPNILREHVIYLYMSLSVCCQIHCQLTNFAISNCSTALKKYLKYLFMLTICIYIFWHFDIIMTLIEWHLDFLFTSSSYQLAEIFTKMLEIYDDAGNYFIF